jgi:hypothetical protein
MIDQQQITNKSPMTTTYQLIGILQQECLEDHDLMFTIIDEYVSSMNEDELKTLEDFVVNNFGDY